MIFGNRHRLVRYLRTSDPINEFNFYITDSCLQSHAVPAVSPVWQADHEYLFELHSVG